MAKGKPIAKTGKRMSRKIPEATAQMDPQVRLKTSVNAQLKKRNEQLKRQAKKQK